MTTEQNIHEIQDKMNWRLIGAYVGLLEEVQEIFDECRIKSHREENNRALNVLYAKIDKLIIYPDKVDGKDHFSMNWNLIKAHVNLIKRFHKMENYRVNGILNVEYERLRKLIIEPESINGDLK